MKLKDGFILREIAGEVIVLPSGDDLDLSAMITLNDSARFVWELLTVERTHEELVAALMKEYPDVTKEKAEEQITLFVNKLKEYELLA